MKLRLDKKFTSDVFHLPGIEPWVIPILKQHKLGLVLDIGVGIGFWGLLIKT